MLGRAKIANKGLIPPVANKRPEQLKTPIKKAGKKFEKVHSLVFL